MVECQTRSSCTVKEEWAGDCLNTSKHTVGSVADKYCRKEIWNFFYFVSQKNKIMLRAPDSTSIYCNLSFNWGGLLSLKLVMLVDIVDYEFYTRWWKWPTQSDPWKLQADKILLFLCLCICRFIFLSTVMTSSHTLHWAGVWLLMQQQRKGEFTLVLT